MYRPLLAGAMFVSLLSAACVTQGKYDEAVRSANAARAELASRTQDCRQRLMELESGRASMQKQLDDATAIHEQLSNELKKRGEDSDALLATNGALNSALESSRRRLEELRRAQAAAEARVALYRELAMKLKGMVDSGDLAITLRDGRMVLRLSNDILFDSGKANLKPNGKRALAEIAAVLSTIPGRHFQVGGHTDNEPIRYSPFHSNWDLSTTRALEVVAFLTSKGMEPQVLSAAGYGEFDPVDTNDTPEGRSHNRRTEISVQPNIDEIVSIPPSP